MLTLSPVKDAILWLFIIQFFFACQSKKPQGEDSAGLDSTMVGDSLTLMQASDSVALSSQEMADYSECVRGHAEPVIKSTVHPQSVFELNKDGHTGTEKIEFQNGDRLVIKNWGCEYYILTFRFETNRFGADTTDTVYWMDKIVTLMSGVESGLDSPLDISTGTAAVKNFLNGEPNYNLGEEIVYDNEEIREYVTIDRIQKIAGSRFAVEVTYAMGPL